MPLPRPRGTIANRLRLLMVAMMLLGLFGSDLARPTAGLAKDVDVVGTVDCGIPSGKRCSFDDTLVLLTDSVTGENELVAIDISWIKRKLPALDQDDEITLCVELLPDGKLKAHCVISAKKRDGTVNQGHSTDTRDVMESRRDRGERQDQDGSNNVRPIGGGVGGTVLNALTGVPVPGATVRLNGFSTTTDAAGAFNILVTVPPGTYQLDVTAPLFFPFTQQVVIQSALTTPVSISLRPQPGVLTGVVRSLVNNGAPVPGATIQVAGFTATTDAAGGFSIGGIPPGTYQATASAAGFISQTQAVTVQATGTTQAVFSLASAFPNITFTLVWGALPEDLDVHLSGPASGGGRFHAFFNNQNPETYAGLILDDRDGFGPERMEVRRNPNTNQFVAGDYHFWVDNPNVAFSPNYAGSQARVIVNRDNQLLGVFDVANAVGNPNDQLWHVVNAQVDAAGNVTLQQVQQFSNGGSFTVLAQPPYGPKPPRR